jgi:hypothetical protein
MRDAMGKKKEWGLGNSDTNVVFVDDLVFPTDAVIIEGIDVVILLFLNVVKESKI